MQNEGQIPNVLAFLLPAAQEILHKAGYEVQVVKTLAAKLPKEFVWRDDAAYVLKQVMAPDHKIILTVGCKTRKEV